jgi:transposase
MAYSLDFRLCVTRNIDNGMSWAEASRVFGISQETLRIWLKRFRNGQDLSDPARARYKPRKIDIHVLKRLIEATPDATLAELGHAFDCTPAAIHYRCVEAKITRKKRQHSIRSGTKKSGKSFSISLKT